MFRRRRPLAVVAVFWFAWQLVAVASLPFETCPHHAEHHAREQATGHGEHTPGEQACPLHQAGARPPASVHHAHHTGPSGIAESDAARSDNPSSLSCGCRPVGPGLAAVLWLGTLPSSLVTPLDAGTDSIWRAEPSVHAFALLPHIPPPRA